ncbi:MULTISPECIES: hypothetical protein [Acidiphilium]|uniref:Uncharacterized protein n=1 Tax=Acidiphilium rubrum TaxID=526 RepID=A0A8G2CNZ6_ACIRU|nr:MULTISPECIES: hypothetical protein [Acidiphilium]SIR52855.1 hypothetical protein SAMN05421828_1472 [Acidiphilium rubrum]
MINQDHAGLSPSRENHADDESTTDAAIAHANSIDYGLMDAIVAETLSRKPALAFNPFDDRPLSTLDTLQQRTPIRVRKRVRELPPPSHRLRDLDMLTTSADRLREALSGMHVVERLWSMEEYHKPPRHEQTTPIPLGAPASHRALRVTDGIVELLKLLAGNARRQSAILGAPDLTPPRRQRTRQLAPAPASTLDVRARLTDIASRYFDQPELWQRLADIAFTCGSYSVDEINYPTAAQSAQTLIHARRWSDHVMRHLLKFPFQERALLFTSLPAPHPMARPKADEIPEHPLSAIRRLRALQRSLLALGDIGYFAVGIQAAGSGVGRRDLSDAAAFAVTSCASIWIANSTRRIEGREPKKGTFSRFVEEFLAEATPIFPLARLHTALRMFHDYRDTEIGAIAEKLGKDPSLFLPAKPRQRRSPG